MSRYLPDFAGIFCLAIFLISLATVNYSILRDGDTFWHIKVGSVMLEQGRLIDSDIFSHTAFGTPWTAHEWLSEIIMAAVHKAAGLEGIISFFLLVVSISFWLLYKISEKMANQWVTFGCVSVALAFSPSHMAARPHLFSWLLMLVTLSILTSGGKKLYWLSAIMVVWANLHGGFVIGLVLQTIFILGSMLESRLSSKDSYRDILSRQKRPSLVLLLSILAIGANPFGYELLLFPFHVTQGIFSQIIVEWQAPNLQDMPYFRFYLMSLILLISLRKSAVTWTERLLIVFFLNAALTHMRHVSLMLIALTPSIARMINNYIGKWGRKDLGHGEKKQLELSSKTGPLAATFIAFTLILAGSIDHRAINFMTPKSVFNTEMVQLNQLVGYLDKNLPQGNMYNDYVLGGYLLYALTPPPKVFIDGRADMYGEKILSDYNKIASSDSEREKLLDKYKIGWVVFVKDSDLVRDLEKSGQWRAAYTNEHYAVLERNEHIGTINDTVN